MSEPYWRPEFVQVAACYENSEEFKHRHTPPTGYIVECRAWERFHPKKFEYKLVFESHVPLEVGRSYNIKHAPNMGRTKSADGRYIYTSGCLFGDPIPV